MVGGGGGYGTGSGGGVSAKITAKNKKSIFKTAAKTKRLHTMSLSQT